MPQTFFVRSSTRRINLFSHFQISTFHTIALPVPSHIFAISFLLAGSLSSQQYRLHKSHYNGEMDQPESPRPTQREPVLVLVSRVCVHAWSRTRAYIHMDRYEYATAWGEIALSGLDTEENRLWSWSNFVIVREILLPSVRENLLLASTFVLRIDCYRLCLVNRMNLFAE